MIIYIILFKCKRGQNWGITSSIMCMGKILVNLDIRECLDEDTTVKWGNQKSTLKLDHTIILFKCNHSYIYVNVAAHYGLSFKWKVGETP